ncbi:hypothetical protein HBH56_030380 [Parastagonospora nodorum]|uniref:F-box domain-containing protein n=2 Tax=Phaeosphaeria nodorum (strain SN15 / ATCC MYA-4574 / FGSC 10173) TaxID=321614 RepID=A0A7U2F698_PHANO|nr:hypothetical protein SNOG_06607 [Parastagonospora nodorum SN15]KAH3919227.1 hypothetical protein HBH56_030380 [Parastagonospora nodorum]EAT86438.1 hypothetical protein SNOG_06607 [Parastagonospora nodorum SN15]KAH3934149.1 hypothetical protein HBH54_051630 [Parastagonospora nodorum]KAH3985194.1 hypothetical protein HBH52_050480 [Parastagonospora nodorum]KAH4066542.1 hypothetical protein HBH50_150480 [Parastagonospora nodorum]
MSDAEIMAAIGMDHQLWEDRPTMPKTKKSFMQKLTERHEALKFQLRSPKLDEVSHDEERAPSRSSTSSSSHKDFFKLAPVTWTPKTDRIKSEFAILYDDIAGDNNPSPSFVQSPLSTPTENDSRAHDQDIARTRRKVNREASASDLFATRPLHSSYSTMSMNSSRLSTPTTTRPSSLQTRARSLPSEMSDEQMDAWLEQPEDAEVHRRRKHSASSALSDHSPTMSQRYVQRRKMTSKAMESSTSPVFHKPNAFLCERDLLQKEFEHMLATASASSTSTPVVQEERNLTLTDMPVEILLEVARYLDTQSAARCRQTCRKFCDTVPAPSKPLSLQKT